CAELGAKPPGSTAGRTQANRIEQAFRAAGLQTSFEDFHVPRYAIKRVRLAVDGGPDVPGETFAYGGTGRVEADVVDVGVGRPADYAGKDVTGKIVMVSRDEAFHRTSQLAQVIARGGAAMLYVSGSPDNLIQEGTVRFAQTRPAPVPAVSVGAEDGAALRARLANGLAMTIEVDARREDAVARNVLGVRRGTTHPDKIMVVGGHYDSWHAGAIDNCTAIGSLLSIVNDVKDVPLAYTVVFAGWDAEELGLVGSYDWVARHADRIGDVVLNENLEMTAANAGATALRFGTGSAVMNALVREAGTANGYAPTDMPVGVVRAISGGILPTDIQPFYSAGVQGFSTFTSTPYYHTPQDVPEHVDRESLRRVSAYLRDALLKLQTATPAELAVREVPRVKVTAPAKADAGAAVPVDIELTDPAGNPIAGAPVRVLVNQNDHWAVAEGTASDLGGGRYRYTLPAGATDADRTAITVTAETPAFMAEGYARVDQRQRGLLAAPAPACTNQRLHLELAFAPPGAGVITSLEATVSTGKAVVLANHLVVVDHHGTDASPVELRLEAKTSSGKTFAQTRSYRACA
ncbi:MAG TPA: M28 family peptidase, partial [Solirubrobacteraceae bacterium]